MQKQEKTLIDKLMGLRKEYLRLTPLYFDYMEEILTKGDQKEKKWAMQELTKAFVKMLPQTLEGSGDGGEFVISWKERDKETDN